MSTLAERLKRAMEMHNPRIRNVDLAKACNLSPPAITEWTSGKTRSITGDNLLRAARYLKVSPDWLASGTGKMRPDSSQGGDNFGRIYGFSPNQVPVIPMEKIEKYLRDIRLGMKSEDEFDMANTTAAVKENTFAIRIQDDSMAPDFPRGAVVIVQPGMEFNFEDFVVVKEGDQCFFSQYIKYGAEAYLNPLNERFPMKKFAGHEVIGVAIELIRKLK